MAPRASWKGYLKLSLVSCSVALFPASNASERISFNTLNRETGNRLKQQMIDSETEEVVESSRKERARSDPSSLGTGRGREVAVKRGSTWHATL